MKQMKSLTDIEQHLAKYECVLLYIQAPNCGVCQSLQPQVQAHLADFPQVVGLRANLAEIPEMASRFHALTAPVVILFHQQQEQWRKARIIPQSELITELEKCVRNEYKGEDSAKFHLTLTQRQGLC